MPSPPPCVGQFEVGDPTCNGDPDGEHEEDRAVCAWRNRCAGLQLHCGNQGFSADEVVATLDYKLLVALCEKQVETHRIAQGVAGGPEAEESDGKETKPADGQPEASKAKVEKKGKPKKKTERKQVSPNKKSQRRVSSPKPPMKNGMLELRAHFETTLRDLFPERRIAAGNRVLVKPGQFYCLDRTRGSRFVSWYCTVTRGRDVALALIKFKPGLKCVHIALPVDAEEMRAFLSKDVLAVLDPQSHRDGQFRSVCKRLDHEGVALVVESIKRLAEADLIALPE